jgi:hypothetical protein
MNMSSSLWIKRTQSILFIAFFGACVDPIDFDLPPADQQLIVEGMITDKPGPYAVKISKSQSLEADSSFHSWETGAQVTLFDDTGDTEVLVEQSPGTYYTTGSIRGTVGHAYHIRIQTADGNIFESEPDILTMGGEVDSIQYEYEARTIERPFGTLPADVFNIYVDGHVAASADSYTRWKFTGTYKVETHPELREIWLSGFYYFKDPYPCSGYEVAPAEGGGLLKQVAPCTCCTCWINQYETEPQLSDGMLVTNNQFKRIKVAEIPIDQKTFHEKYRVDIEQMSLSRTAFDFFKLIRAQKKNAASIFQPPSGKIIGNIKAVGSNAPVVGLFWATSVNRKQIYISKDAVPYLIASYPVPAPCTRYANSSTEKPETWDE